MKRQLFLIFAVVTMPAWVYSMGVDTLKLSLPSINWAIEIVLPDFNQAKMNMSSEIEGRYLYADNDSLHTFISIGIEENKYNYQDCTQLRDASWAELKSQFVEKEVLLLDSAIYVEGRCAFADYTILSIDDELVMQKNLIAYFIQNNICVTVQLAKTMFQEKDFDLFKQILGSLKIIAPYRHLSIEHFIDACSYFAASNYLIASRIYQKALFQDQKDHLLSQEQFYILLSNLGLSYGMTGQTQKGIDLLNRGIAYDRFFPMFYYNLAVVYAQVDNLVETIYYLSQAYMNKKSMPAEEEFPDPRKDILLKKYWKNDRFKEFVRSVD
jgi:tetratricopeptide (TPR) repeat protein